MSKICPNCKEIYYDDEEFICGSCGVNLVEMTEKPNPTLHLGDANAISGGVSINQSKNITSHDVHYHTVQERNKSEKELLQDRQNQYHDTVAKLLKGGVITVEARAQLDKLKFNLGLDDSIAANIEATVKNEQKTQARAGNDGLSVIGKMALKSAVAAVEENSPQVQSCIVKLAPVCKTTMNEQVHFYYSMLLAASDPQCCVEAYEKRTIDSYWLSYWASVAYRKLGNEMEAEGILTEMTGLWQERPEINVVINACLGIWLSCSGNLAECQETIIEYLTQTEEVPSEELNDLFHALLHAVGVAEEDYARFAFYNEHFLMVLNEEAELKKAQEAYDNKDYETALAIWNRLAERNNAVAIRKVGVCYAYGNGVTQNKAEAVSWYRKAADLDNDVAMYNLGYCYENGLGVTQDNAEAVKWYQKAADLGDANAMVNLGNSYFFGDRGVSQDYAEAVKWYRKAAELGDVDAMFNLGNCYYNGWGVTEDYTEAVRWYQKAADSGDNGAMAELGNCYRDGKGVTQDYAEAVKWYQKAADMGHAEAMFNLGCCYESGQGVSQDGAEALKWYRKAAELGNVACISFIAYCYETGEGGVSVDLAEALKWYRKAKELGNDTGADIQRIESKLKPTATTTHNCQRIPNLPKAAFEKAWVTQENEQTIGIHYSLNITNMKGKVVSFKCTTKSLSRGSTVDKSTNVIHVHEEKSDALNWDDTRWDDWKYFLNESDIMNTLAFDYRNPYELETELSAYDGFNNCIGSYWIRYKVIHEARVIKGNRLLLSNQDNKSFNEQINEMITELEQLNNQIEKYKKNKEK